MLIWVREITIQVRKELPTTACLRQRWLSSDLANLFNTLTGYTRKPSFRKILVAPYTLHDEVIRMIREETKAAKSGKEARILIKVNSLVDPQCINELYLASQAGVKIDLIVRGICGLIPGVKGMSENVRVISLLGRFLEHSRVFHFHNAPPGKRTFLGSPDWMPRNFFRRIEVAFPIEDFNEEAKIMESMDSFIRDNEFSTHLRRRVVCSAKKAAFFRARAFHRP